MSQTPAEASSGPGSSGAAFLKIPVSARAVALGGTLGAEAGDVASIDTNVAGLADLRRTDLQATHIAYFEDTSVQSISLGAPFHFRSAPILEPLEGVEFPPNQMGIGLEYRLFKAEDTGRNDSGIKLDKFDVRDQLIALGLAYPFRPRLSLGVAGKMIGSKVQDKSTNSTAFDAAALYRLNSRWSFGTSVQNFGSALKYNGSLGSAEYTPPLTARGSASFKSNRWLTVADLSYSINAEILRASGGVEWSANRFICFRGGLFHATTLEFTGGLGLRMDGPQKAASSPSRSASKSKHLFSSTPSPLAENILAQSAEKLIESYKPTKIGDTAPTLSVLSFNSSDGAAMSARRVFEKRFADSGEFKMLLGGGPSEYIVSGNVEKTEDRYSINTRLIRMEDGETVGANHAEIAVEDFYERKKTLDSAPARSSSDFSRLNLGLDYGLSTQNEFGVTHTITLRILY